MVNLVTGSALKHYCANAVLFLVKKIPSQEQTWLDGQFSRLSLKPPSSPAPNWDKSASSSLHKGVVPVADSTSSDSKVAPLRAYRCARGLCQFCADKWAKGHKCAPTVQLHVLQDLWDLLLPDQPKSEDEFQDFVEQFMLLLSEEALSPQLVASLFHLSGFIQGTEILILLDSGSSNCFLNSTIGSFGVLSQDRPLSVKVDDGNVLHYTTELANTEWSVQDLKFCSTFVSHPMGLSVT